jgi:hypothetical protein
MSRMARERTLAIELRASGLAAAVIAERLGVSPGTVTALLRRRPTFPTRTCLLCGNVFTPTNGRQRYCCVEHRERHRRPGLTPRECRHCGARFTPTSGGQRYCTPEHQRLHSPQTVAQARERLASLEAELARARDQLREAA